MAGSWIGAPRVWRALAVVVALLAPRAARGAWDCGACAAAPPDPHAVLYQLSDASTFEVGCFDPCACPVLQRSGLGGTFTLTPYRSDPLFAEYLLCGIDWSIPASGTVPALHITGEGWYRVGGEVAVQQELRLCVSVNGGPTQRFESGLVAGGGGFPTIAIAAATSGFYCWDSVVTVKAGPASAGIPLDEAGAIGVRALPNPSPGPVKLEVFLREEGAITLAIVDIQGREIRRLEDRVWHPAGRHVLHWDGTRRDGSRAPAGLYLLRLRAGGHELSQRLIRL